MRFFFVILLPKTALLQNFEIWILNLIFEDEFNINNFV